MTKKKDPNALPLRVHKATNQAYVLVDGARHYLGRHDAPDAQARYDQFLVEWLANGRRLRVESSDLTIVELADRFKAHVDSYYLDANGKSSREAKNFLPVFKAVKELYGRIPACEFGPLKLKAVRERLMADDIRTRDYVNKLITKLRMMFRWAVTEELLPASVYQALQAVPGLKRGRTTARESGEVTPVPVEFVDAIRPYVSKQVAAIIDLQLLTAARQGEIVIMRSVDIDMTGKVWTYAPKAHKTAYRGHKRKIYLGPKAQEIIRPFLDRPVEAFLFSPAEAEAVRLEERSKARKTPDSCGNVPGSNRIRKPRKAAGPRYTSNTYGQAIAQACKRADVPAWHPHQLRHSAATNLRKEFGLDVAQLFCGHKTARITEHYAELDTQKAAAVALKIG